MVRSNCCHWSRYSDMTVAITIGLLVTSSHNWSPTLGQWTSRQSRILTRHKDRPLRSVTGDLQSSAKMRIISKGHRICIVCALVFVQLSSYFTRTVDCWGPSGRQSPEFPGKVGSMTGESKAKGLCLHKYRIQRYRNTKIIWHKIQNNANCNKCDQWLRRGNSKALVCTNSKTGNILGILHSKISLVFFDSHLKVVFVKMWILIRSSKMKKEEKAKVRQWPPLSQWRSPAESVEHEF